MNNFIFKFILVFSIFVFCFNLYSFADDIEQDEDNNFKLINSEITSETSTNVDPLSTINSRAYVVIDRNTHMVLCGKNENETRKMASTTKIMTATVVLENTNLNDIVTVSKKAAGTGGSRLGLKTNDKVSVLDLLYGLLLCSGNDAAVALAEFTCGSIEEFSKLMNEKAKTLGLTNTNFVTPHGLDSSEHYTTAYELAVLTCYALQNDTFLKIVGTKNYTITINGYPKSINNTNELLGNLYGVYGVKTGFTNGANRCLVTSCKRGDLDIICVVLGADTKNFRTKDSIKLINYAFSNFTIVNVKDIIYDEFEFWKLKNLSNINVNKASCTQISLNLSTLKYDYIPVRNNEISDLYAYIDCNLFFEAPLNTNDVLGKAYLYNGDDIVLECDIVLGNSIPKKGIFDYFSSFFYDFKTIVSFSI